MIKGYRPDRTEDTKRDEDYHVKWGKYSIGEGFDSIRFEHMQQIKLNRNFFFDKQWENKEDTESFLMDSSNQSKNRIKVTKNFIKPIIMQYLGNAAIMDITFQARSTSFKAINRREEKLAEMMYYTNIAALTGGEFAEFLKKQYPIGETPEETEQMFENHYHDNFAKGINQFINYIAEENQFDRKKIVIAFDIALTGIGLLKYTVYNGEFKWDRLLAEQFFFDRTAQEPDLSDCAFQGFYEYMTSSTIFEKWTDIKTDAKKAIESYTQRIQSDLTNKGKVQVYTVYWRDYVEYQYGYVMDEFDYPYLTKINYTYENEDEPRYTDEDLIPVGDLNDHQKKILRNKNKAKIVVDLIRFIEFIPGEILPYTTERGEQKDIVLDYGILSFQDTENQNMDNVSYPIKSYCWIYHKGFIDTPVSSLINPQRMINRYAAVEQQQVSSSHGRSLFYDEMLTSGTEDEAMMLSNMYQGKPTKVNTKGLGIHNLMGEYGSTVGNETLVYESLQNSMKADMDRIIGVNESLRGEQQPEKKLVGVQQLEIQRASLIQEPFYYALSQVFLQAYQSTANVGRRVYVNFGRKLAIAVGDKYAEVIKLSKEYNTEDFRVFIKREPDVRKQIESTNQLLFALRAQGLLDETRFADLFNRSTLDDVAISLREFTAEKMEAVRESGKLREIEDTVGKQEMTSMEEDARTRGDLEKAVELSENEKDRQTKLTETVIKNIPKT